MREVRPRSQEIGQFLEWLREAKGYYLCEDLPTRYSCAECGEVPEDRVKYAEDGLRRHCADCGGDVLFDPGGTHSASYRVEQLLAEYFEIDLEKVETERRSMLDELHAAGGPSRPSPRS